MAAKKAAKAATQAPQVINAAPSFTPPPAEAYPPPAPFTPPNGAFTAPPPQAPKNPFINAMFLYQRGGSVQAKILALRPIPGGGVNKFGQVDRGGWYLDCQLTDGTMVTARVNIGDQRHHRLFSRHKNPDGVTCDLIGKTAIFRLPTPADNTKAAWTVDA